MLLAAALTVLVLEDFEDIKDMRASASRATAAIAQSTEKVKAGRYSGQLTYDFAVKESAGTSVASMRHRPAIAIKERPKKIGVWVYGDASHHWLRGLYRDGKGLAKDIDFTAEPEPPALTADECASRDYGINWTGWKYVEATIPVDAALPLMWERLYIAENSDACDDTSSIFFDDLRAVYTDEDLVGPEISETFPRGRVYTTRPEIGALVKDAQTVRMTIDGNPVELKSGGQAISPVRYTPSTPLTEGQHRVRIEAKDRAGNDAIPAADWTFTVYTGPDRDGPLIDRAQPLDGILSRFARPRVSARVRDEHRGVDPSKIAMTIDGVSVKTQWNDGVVWHAPEKPLSKGAHEVALQVTDRAGNLSKKSWTFHVDAIARRAPFRFTWIADGGYFEGTEESEATRVLQKHLEEEQKNKPDFLIFGGDIVENDQAINYERALAALQSVGVPFLVTAGNHEISGTLSRDRFWRTFGPTIAATDIGPVAFVMVDLANSEYEWDPSQFAWLERELARSEARTLFVIHHAPTRDPFASGHGIPAEEGKRVESILAAAKKARPKRDIIVLSGDAHAYARWTRDGVEYVISGGGGGGLDASPENGGFFHRLHVTVDETGKATIGVRQLAAALNSRLPTMQRAARAESRATLGRGHK